MENMEVNDILMFLATVFSLVVSYYCVKKAEKPNRNRFGWGYSASVFRLLQLLLCNF